MPGRQVAACLPYIGNSSQHAAGVMWLLTSSKSDACSTCRRRPYAVVLFDEVEKAHADVFNILLQAGPPAHALHQMPRRCAQRCPLNKAVHPEQVGEQIGKTIL